MESDEIKSLINLMSKIPGLGPRSARRSVLSLIKKTELLLRKNDALFLPITQRFLLNIKKTLN